jgi:acid phosphatase (class A)
MAGSAMFAVLNGSRDFRRDMDAARGELASIGSGAPAPDPAQCRADQAVLAKRPW